MKFVPGKGADLEIKLANSEVHTLRSFMNRKEAVQKIVEQAKNNGKVIKIFFSRWKRGKESTKFRILRILFVNYKVKKKREKASL